MMVAYTDGACTGNPGPGGWGAVLLLETGREEISGGAPHTTNNRMELTAVIEALRRVSAAEPVLVVTDSQYVLRGMTQWVAGWRKRGWRTATGGPVLNQDLWETLAALVDDRVTWEWVKGHAGDPENERADRLARTQAKAAARTPGQTRAGSRAAPAGAPGRSSGGAASGPEPGATGNGAGLPTGAPVNGRTAGAPGGWPTYLSLVDGRLMRHRDWPSCERRVHGQRGARFKKCRSAEEERATVAGWKLPTALLAGAIDG